MTVFAPATVMSHERNDTEWIVPEETAAHGEPPSESPDAEGNLAAPELAFTDENCATDDAALAQAKLWREDVGLPSDDATMAASIVDPSYRCTAFGISLTDEELAEFASVLEAQDELSLIVEQLIDEPTYAGAYLVGSHLTLMSTDGLLGLSVQPTLGSISVVQAQYPESELKALSHEIATTGLDDAQAHEIRISRVEANVKTNRVEIGVASDKEAASEYFGDRYGSQVVVLSEAIPEGGGLFCTQSDCGTKGGLEIDHAGPVGCTSGFVARARQGTTAAWNAFFYTAGHCIVDAGGIGNSSPWRNGASTLTWGTNKLHNQPFIRACGFATFCLDNDNGLFRFGSNPPTQYNRYFVGGGSTVAIVGRTQSGSQLVGQVVWRYGRTSHFDSGAISGKPDVWASSNWGITDLQYNVIKVNMVSDNGDSGAGMYRLASTSRYAYGVLSGGDSPGVAPPTYYTPWDADIEGPSGGEPFDRWHIEPCISTGCGL